MSYLVDALRKAERERHARQAQDIHALSASAASGATAARGSTWLWLVAILVASNVALAIYIWRPRPANSAPSPVMEQYRSLPTANALAQANPGATAPKTASDNSASTPSPSSIGRDQATSTVKDIPQTRQAPRSASSEDHTSNAGPSARDAGAMKHGRVTYSKVPLAPHGADDSARVNGRDSKPENASDTPDQSELSNVPSVDINGQLYSTVPGRSFILVGGRRYHEGERLASGPAVESIQPNGATLRYHGQRYRVAGPG